MKKIAISLLLIVLLSVYCHAASLDDPAKREIAPMTIKNELERASREGFAAKYKADNDVFKLAMFNPIKYSSTPQALVKAYDESLSQLIRKNSKNNTGTTAYLAGVYAIFWEATVRELKDNATTSLQAKNYFLEFRKRQKQLAIDNKTFFSFFFQESYNIQLQSTLNKWIEINDPSQ